MNQDYKYIYFQEILLQRKTKTFLALNKNSGESLGAIKWYAPWRKYCFFVSDHELVFDASCLADIQDFLNKLMQEKKEAKKDAGNE